MEKFFQKYNWAINFAVIGLSTLLVALLINSIIAAQLAELTVPELPSFEDVQPDDGPADLHHDERGRWADELAARCLFGCPEPEDPHECPEGCPEGEVCERGECVPEDPEEDEEDPHADIPTPSELQVELTGVLATANPQWSVAMIYDEVDNESHVLGVGDELPADEPTEILEIRRDRIFIDNDGRLEFIRLAGSSYPDPDPDRIAEPDPRQGPPEDPRGGDDQEDEQRRSGVVREGPRTYVIETDRLEREFGAGDRWPDEARLSANITSDPEQGERRDGIRVRSSPPGSFLSDIGLEQGDVIEEIDGNEVNRRGEVTEGMEGMAEQEEVTIRVRRDGRSHDYTYRIRS